MFLGFIINSFIILILIMTIIMASIVINIDVVIVTP